ncbi:alpha/beta hydrolase [Pseudomonas aeruginosa]|uniref:Alpha/beta hydrolase n=1 Tax=Pseudomonas paraeruginosa (strain DSM 24068 / PA7) TaxID=381754 RepID=A6V0B6_PSEP7|nr:alpha/beta hydrolase [Pseudomonas aeruginosa PA7]OKR57909.1 alpha/beta hydrolase [Pseudomonas aeruginosa]
MSRYAFASTDDLEIAYLEWSPQGERNAVLLHGWPDSPHGWKAVAETLASAGYRVLAPARFRHAATPRSGQLAALGCDLLGLIDSLALRRPLLVGMTGALARWPMLAACARALAHREAQLLPRHAWLCLHGGADACTHPDGSRGREQYFSGRYRRLLLDGVGHFPPREAALRGAAEALAGRANNRIAVIRRCGAGRWIMPVALYEPVCRERSCRTWVHKLRRRPYGVRRRSSSAGVG